MNLPEIEGFRSSSDHGKFRFTNDVIPEEILEENKDDEKLDNKDFLKKLVKMQGLFRMKKDLKSYKQMKKKLVHRKYILEELIKTEENFKNSLFCVIEKVINPLKEKKILKSEEIRELFSNLESIAGFSETFHTTLYKKFNYNYENTKTKFVETVLMLLPFFKLYYEYCHKYSGAVGLLASLRKSNSKFSDFLENIELTEELQYQELSSHLIKPIQRLPKYVLLFKDLLKNTEPYHPDYKNIENALKEFQKINNENDKQILQKVRIFELQEKYGPSLNFAIPDSQREFLEEESLVLLSDRKTIIVIVYFLTDLMLITEQNFMENKLIKYLTFDYNSYVRDMPTTRYFKWSLSVFGKEGGITFIFESKETKMKLYDFLNIRIFSEIKAKIKSKISGFSYYGFGNYIKNKQITIKVLGSSARGLDHIKPYTVYIIEIKYEEIIHRIFVRYKELLKLQEIILKEYSGVKIDRLPPKHFWTEQKSYTIESRKFHIEFFLRSILANEIVMNNKEKVLETLGLPLTFYKIETLNNDVRQKNNDFLENSNSLLAERLKRKKSVYQTFLAYLKNARKIFYGLDELFLKKSPKAKIVIHLMDNQVKTIEISKETRAFDVCKQLSEDIGLISWFDFKLCLVSSSFDEIMINDDEYLWKALDIELNQRSNKESDSKLEIRNKSNSTKENDDPSKVEDNKEAESPIRKNISRDEPMKPLKNFWSKIKEKISSFFQNHIYCNSKLAFKKVYYLPAEVEEVDYKTDLFRLDLLISQTLYEIQQNKLSLSFHDYCLFGSLKVYMNYGSIYSISPLELQSLFKNEILPKTIPGLILYQQKWDFWFNNISWFWKNFSDEIEKIIELNKKYNEQVGKKILDNLVKKQQLEISKRPIDGKIISKFVMLNCAFRTSLFGTQRFFVSLFNEEPIQTQTYWLAPSFEKIQILDLKTCKEFKRFNYDDIESIYAAPTTLEIACKNEKYSCHSSKAFEIKERIENYMQLRRIFAKIRKLKKSPQKVSKEDKKSGFFNK